MIETNISSLVEGSRNDYSELKYVASVTQYGKKPSLNNSYLYLISKNEDPIPFKEVLLPDSIVRVSAKNFLSRMRKLEKNLGRTSKEDIELENMQIITQDIFMSQFL